MLILGLDPGSEKLGYGFIKAEGELLSYVEAGVLTAPAAWDKYRRLAELGKELEALFRERAVDEVALEAGFIAPSKGFLMQGALVSAAARGMAGYLAARAGRPVTEYAPTSVKKAVTGNGRAEKPEVARAVQLLLCLQRQPEPDAGDALAIAVTHARRMVVDLLVSRAARAA